MGKPQGTPAATGTLRRQEAFDMAQLALFPDIAAAPGLHYQRDFISEGLERELIAHIAGLPLQRFQFGAFEGNRRVAWFGFRYDYTEQKLRQAEPIPDWLAPITREAEAFAGLPPGSVRQILCTEYDVGVGIGWHRDKPQFDRILGLSLGADCKFRFRRRSGEKWQRYTLAAERRSIYMMEAEVRQQWEHSIPPVEARRYSITFRTMRPTQVPG